MHQDKTVRSRDQVVFNLTQMQLIRHFDRQFFNQRETRCNRSRIQILSSLSRDLKAIRADHINEKHIRAEFIVDIMNNLI